MNTKLKHIENWEELAQKENWSVSKIAKRLKVSTDTLRRHFLSTTGKSPRQWLAEERQRQAKQLLGDGASIKEAAAWLGYKQQTNFSRKFKYHWGSCPTKLESSKILRNPAGK